MAGQPSSWTGYWAAASLSGMLPQPYIGSAMIHASSNPLDLVKFQTIIDEVSAEFDQAAARAGYLIPIPSTATSAYLIAQQTVRNGAIADALRVTYTGPDQKYVDRYELAYRNALEALEQGDRPLPGAPSDTNSTSRLMPQWSGIASPLISASMGAGAMLSIPNDF